MSMYNANQRLNVTKLVDDVRNGLALRSDLNQPAFDAGKFVIVPKVCCRTAVYPLNLANNQ